MQQNQAKNIVTRFAPSPTGLLQAGNYRTALFSYLFARQNGGKFILRIEDTDKARSKKEFEDNIIESLAWLGLGFDERFRQSDRTAVYRSYMEKLIAADKAYLSTEKHPETGVESTLVRFRNPKKRVKFTDLIRGDIEFDTTELGDFVIGRTIDEPVFHLVVVVDDHEMGITHVVRGEDHISNTPRHILIAEAIGATVPTYAHLPLLLAPDRSKLSKRKGAKAMTQYRAEGFLPEAIVNYLALLGWNPGTPQELFTLDELVKAFDLSKVQKSGAIFSEEKLAWFNRAYIQKLTLEAFEALVSPFVPRLATLEPALRTKVVALLKDRVSTLVEAKTLMDAGEFDWLLSEPKYEPSSLMWKTEQEPAKARERLEKALSLIETVPEGQLTRDTAKAALWPYAEEAGRGAVLWPLRFALSGKEKSPDPFILLELLGKETSKQRILNAIKSLS